MIKKTKLASLILLLMASSPAHSSMENVFNDMYNATPPNFSQQGSGRYGASFGSFSYRPSIDSNINVLSARMPNFQVDKCGSIDMFAGSFSFISGDELSQVARGVMQGAATYAFDLALNAISPSAGQIKENIMKLINEMNKFTRDSCAMGQNVAKQLAGNPNTTGALESESLNQALNSISTKLGDYADYTETAFNSVSGISEKATKAGINVDSNVTMDALKKSNAQGDFFGSFLSMRPNELAQTLIGSHITNTTTPDCAESPRDGEKTCLKPLAPKGALAFVNLFIDLEQVNSLDDYSFKYYKCESATTCITPSESSIDVTRLLPKLRKDIAELWDTTVKGNVALTQNQKLLNYFLGNDMLATMKKLGFTANTREQYVNLKSLTMTKVMMDYLEVDFYTKNRESLIALKAANQTNQIPILGIQEVLRNLDNFHKDYQDLTAGQLDREIDKVFKEFSQYLVMQSVSNKK
ncbi:conjugal transfer protein TraH (plasmid) [Shewanella sp. HL-SH4]|uniref:conjugal transfer protein TraH n=1 Tax=Shewanella sp. HL-SH4 TaxID=3436240 RepID=UPI003EC14EB9